MRDYGRVHSTFWSSPTIRAMSEDARALALYLLTSPHTTITGAFRLPDGYVCEDMQWTAQRVSKGFMELFENGFANRCETTKWVWIAKFLEWNKPENPNQWKAARKLVAQVPDECGWKLAFMRVVAFLDSGDGPPDFEPFANPFETLSKPGTGTGTGTGEREDSPLANARGAPVAGATVTKPNGLDRELEQQIIGAYHELLPALPAVKVWNAQRHRLLSDRIRERERAGKPARTVDYWRQLFAKVAASDFLCGRAKPEWRAQGLEWLLKPKNFTKLIEGAYDNRG